MALFAKWLMYDSAASTTVTEAGASYDGTLNVNTNTRASLGRNKVNTALYFNASQYFTAGSVTDFKWMHYNATNDFTWSVSFWYQSNVSGSKNLAIIGTSRVGSSSSGFVIFFDARAVRLLISRKVSGQPVLDGTVSAALPDDAKWHHVAVTYDQSLASANGIVYVDGVNKGTMDKTVHAPANNDSSYALTVGVDADLVGYEFQGKLSDIRIYDAVLTSAEVNTLAAVTEEFDGIFDYHTILGQTTVSNRYPAVEGLIAGVTKQTGSPIIDPRGKNG